VGTGFAGPAVVGNRVVVFHRVGESERVECLDANTGKSIWRADFPATYRPGVNPDDGPRCVPLVHEQRVYLHGAAGNLYCVELASGRKIWTRDAFRDYGGQEGYFGAGSTPIIADQKLLVNVGGRNAGIVAFDLLTGETRWQATDERASYSSPTMAEFGKAPHVIFLTRLKCVALEPQTGRVAFSFPFGLTGTTVNAATPIIFDNKLFITANYRIGALLVKLDDPATKIWANDDSMSSQYSTSVHHRGYLYGMHGREDLGTGELRCVAASTGEVKWSVPAPHTGSLILVGNQLLVLTTDGSLLLIEARSDRYAEQARTQLIRHPTRSLPALSSGKFVYRDNSDAKAQLTCLKLR
jgi:outer membrane protein assembly factor BamB